MSQPSRRNKIPAVLAAFLLSWCAVALVDALLTQGKGFLDALFTFQARELSVRTLAALLAGFFAFRSGSADDQVPAQVTQRVAAERFSALLDSAADAACLVNENGEIEAANTAFFQGYGTGTAAGSRLTDLPDKELREALEEVCSEAGSTASKVARKAQTAGGCRVEVTAASLGPHEPLLLPIRDISLEKEFEELAAAMREPYRSCLEKMATPAGITLADGTFQVVNQPLAELIGLSREALEGNRVVGDFLAPDQEEAFLRGWESGSEEATAAGFEVDIRNQAGATRSVALQRTVMDATGQSIVFLRDLTREKQSLEELRASRATLSLVERISRMGNWEWDVNTDTITWSEEMYRIFGATPGEFLPTYETYLSAVHNEDKEQVIQAINNALYNKKPYGLDHRIVLPDGTVRTHSARAEVSYDAQGRPLRMVGTNQDITWRIEAEQALRNSEEKFSKAFHASPDSIVITRADDGTYIDVNEAFQEMTGYTREEVLGRSSYADLKLWVDPDARMMMLKLMNQYGHVRNLEVRFRVKSGDIKELLWSADVIEYGGEACLIAISRDVTEQRHLEQELLKSEAKLYMKHEELKNLFQQMEGIRREWEETMDCISDQFILSDQWGRVRRFNRAVEEFSKKAHRDLVGRECAELLDELGLKEHREAPGVELYHEQSGRWFVLKRFAFPAIEGDGTMREVVIISDTTDIRHRGETEDIEKSPNTFLHNKPHDINELGKNGPISP